MVTSPTRRRLLRGLGSAIVGATAGCSKLRTETTTNTTVERTDAAIADERNEFSKTADAMFRGGYRRQGYQPDAVVSNAVERDWRIPGINKGDHTAAKASPVHAPTGDIVVPGDDGTVYALAPNGEVYWAAATDPSGRGIHGTPTIANGAVYVGAYDGAVYAFDLRTGERKWRTELGDAIGSSPTYYDGSVYIPVEYSEPSGSVFAVNAEDGAIEWEDDRPTDHPHSTPALDLDANKLVVGSNDGRLYAWHFDDRSFAWSFDTGRPIKGPVATLDGSAFFGSWDDKVYRVDLDSGREEWSFETGHYVMSGPGIDPETGTVYVGSHDSHVYALDAATGERLWSYETDGWIIGCPTITKESVLIGSYDSRLYALDKATGDERWSVGNVGRVTSEALVVGDGIYYTERATDDASGGVHRLRAVD